MQMFEDVVGYLARIEGAAEPPNRRRHEAHMIDALRRRHPGIPEDYLTYLQEVGSGAMRACGFAVYSTFIEPSYFFGDEALGFDASIVCFGHDYTGDQSGFRLDNWKIVEIHDRDIEVTEHGSSFSSYIRSRLKGLDDARLSG